MTKRRNSIPSDWQMSGDLARKYVHTRLDNEDPDAGHGMANRLEVKPDGTKILVGRMLYIRPRKNHGRSEHSATKQQKASDQEAHSEDKNVEHDKASQGRQIPKRLVDRKTSARVLAPGPLKLIFRDANKRKPTDK